MIRVQGPEVQPYAGLFFPEGPGPMVGRHILNTGCGAFYADRKKQPRVVFSRAGGNLALAGNPESVTPQALRKTIHFGMLEAREDFEDVLREAFPDLVIWPRLVYTLEEEPVINKPAGFFFRQIGLDDVPALKGLSPENHWIWNTWKNPETLAASGHGWGAFSGDRLVSLANSFFLGDLYEDIGVITEAGFRRRGLSSACAGLLCLDIQSRGRTPSWSTETRNIASRRVAEKNGFRLVRNDFLYVINASIPDPSELDH